MQISQSSCATPSINSSVVAGDSSVADPSYAVTLPNGEASTWNISQNLTDRWGELNFYKGHEKPLQPLLGDSDLFERLLNQMWDELTFVVRKDGAYGLLFELEYSTRESEVNLIPRSATYEQELSKLKPESDLRPILVECIAKLAAKFPGVQFCLPPKEEMVEERLGIWAFVADGQLDDAEREKLGQALLAA